MTAKHEMNVKICSAQCALHTHAKNAVIKSVLALKMCLCSCRCLSENRYKNSRMHQKQILRCDNDWYSFFEMMPLAHVYLNDDDDDCDDGADGDDLV